MGLINPKPRFGYDSDADMIYDYLVQRDVALSDAYRGPDGVWNLFEVKRLILSGQSVEYARLQVPAEPLAQPPVLSEEVIVHAPVDVAPEVPAEGQPS